MLLLGDLLPSLKFKSFVTMPASTEADSNWRDLPIFKLGMREHLDGPPCRACGHFPISVTSRCLPAGLCDELSLWEIRVVGSLVEEDVREADAATGTLTQAKAAQTWLPLTWTQKADLIALSRASPAGKDPRVNVHTNFTEAFPVLHGRAAI